MEPFESKDIELRGGYRIRILLGIIISSFFLCFFLVYYKLLDYSLSVLVSVLFCILSSSFYTFLYHYFEKKRIRYIKENREIESKPPPKISRNNRNK